MQKNLMCEKFDLSRRIMQFDCAFYTPSTTTLREMQKKASVVAALGFLIPKTSRVRFKTTSPQRQRIDYGKTSACKTLECESFLSSYMPRYPNNITFHVITCN